MTGSLRGARFALAGLLPIIGSGNYRIVYREADTVYKVEYDDGIEFHSNRSEYDNWSVLNAMSLPDNVAIPDVSIYRLDGIDVIAMPYITGTPTGECFCLPGEAHYRCLPPGLERDLLALGIDAAYGNLIESGGTYWLVDFDSDLG